MLLHSLRPSKLLHTVWAPYKHTASVVTQPCDAVRDLRMAARLMVGVQPRLQLCRGLADWPLALPQSAVQPRVEQVTLISHGGPAVGSCSLLDGDMVSPRAPP